MVFERESCLILRINSVRILFVGFGRKTRFRKGRVGLFARIFDAAVSINKREDQLTRTKRIFRQGVMRIEVYGGIFENLLLTAKYLPFLCNKFVF